VPTTPPDIPAPGPPRFDDAAGAWLLTRYADVLAALHHPLLTAGAAWGGTDLDRAVHLNFRSQSAAAAAGMLDERLSQMALLADGMAGTLPQDRPVDLAGELAQPWSLQLACSLSGPSGGAQRMAALSAGIFAAAAEPLDAALRARAEQSTLELAAMFSGPLAAFHLQAFIALSQTLPCFLANAWLALLHDPENAALLGGQPQLMPAAIEELLRHSGPARAQFRRATADVELGGAIIPGGSRVALMLAAANRDPQHFSRPDTLDFHRPAPRHLAFGDGRHACIGAPVVRAAAAAATAAFIRHFAGARLARPVEWRGGFAICAPASLFVSRQSPDPGSERAR
jgi:hypothetical protein